MHARLPKGLPFVMGDGGQSVFIVRHGEREDQVGSDWVSKSSRPAYDPALTDKGQRQAQEVGGKLRGLGRVSS